MGQAWEALMSSLSCNVGAFLAADFQYPTPSALAIEQRFFVFHCLYLEYLLQYVHDCGIRVGC